MLITDNRPSALLVQRGEGIVDERTRDSLGVDDGEEQALLVLEGLERGEALADFIGRSVGGPVAQAEAVHEVHGPLVVVALQARHQIDAQRHEVSVDEVAPGDVLEVVSHEVFRTLFGPAGVDAGAKLDLTPVQVDDCIDPFGGHVVDFPGILVQFSQALPRQVRHSRVIRLTRVFVGQPPVVQGRVDTGDVARACAVEVRRRPLDESMMISSGWMSPT